MKKEFSFAFGIFFLIVCLFFYKTLLHGFIPFPGDLLVSEYNPWKSYVYLGYNPGSFPSKAQYFDVLRQLYPWRTLGMSLIQQHQVPLWNPYNFSGTPLLANFQSAIFYPLSLLYFLIKQPYAWATLVFLQPLLTGFFTYLFARKLKISIIGSYVAGTSFAFSTFLVVLLEYNTVGQVIVWFPLLLLSIEHLLEKKTYKWVLVFLFSLICSGLGGHPQIFFYSLFFSAIYALYRIISTKEKSYGKIRTGFLFFLFAIGGGILAIQYIPGFELISLSARSSHEYSVLMQKLLIQPWQFIMLLIPDFFGNPATRNYWPQDTYAGKMFSIGVVPLVFSFLALSYWKNSLIRFFVTTALVVFVLVTANPISALLYKIPLPFFSSSSPTLSIFLFCFSLSIISGFGITIFQEKKLSMKHIYLLGIPGIIIMLAIFTAGLESKIHLLQGVDHAKLALKNSIIPISLFSVTIFGIVFSQIKKKWIPVILIILLIMQLGDSWRFFLRFNPFVSSELIYPGAKINSVLLNISGIDRVWGFGAATFEANVTSQVQLFSPDGYDPLYPKWYGEFIQGSNQGAVVTSFTDRTRSDAIISPASSFDFMSNQYRQKILNILGVAYIVDNVSNNSTENTFPPIVYENVYKDSFWKIYRNKYALPRVFLTTSYATYVSPEDFSKKFFSSSFDLHTILLERAIPQALSGKGNAQIIAYTANTIKIKTNSTGSQLLFLSDTYYPGWKAYVDEKSIQIMKADYAFRSILIPPGVHMITFSYQPESFNLGIKTTILSIIVLCLGLFLVRKIHYEK